MSQTITEHIETTVGVCGGRPRIAGHRIRVQDIVVWHECQGQSADEIVARFPQLTLADVHAALAYYFDHREQIRQQIEDDKRLAQELQGKSPSKLAAKLASLEAGGDSVSC